MRQSRVPEEPWYTPMIVEFLIHDVPRLSGIPERLVARDVHTFERRLAAEGEGFVTKTLPSLGKAIDLALQGGSPLTTRAFKKIPGSALPRFLSALLGRVFLVDGWIRDDACIVCIRLLRQITFWCKKIEKEASDESLQKAYAEFVQIDENLDRDISIDFCDPPDWLRLGRVLVERALRNFEVSSINMPRHGPGAVAGGEGTLGKRKLDTSYKKLEEVFRPIPWFRSLRDAAEDPCEVTSRTRKEVGYDKLSHVFKDSTSWRLIGLPPAEYMWCQQAVKTALYDFIENTSQILRGHVNFTDQTINRELAKDWRNCETLDMSKASDRNSLSLVRYLFGRTAVWPYLEASRTPGITLPDGRTLLYKKFAPMGSATCFPVQAVVYYCLAVASLHSAGVPLLLAIRSVYVYGDDLIVPRGHFLTLQRTFSSVGLKFNEEKCCLHGRFRESCGMDAYDGVDVTPVRLRRVYGSEPSTYLAIVAHANELYKAGYYAASHALRCLALRAKPRLRALNLPSYEHELPVLAWLDATATTLPRAVLRKPKDGISHLVGWCYEPHRLEAHLADEKRYLREVLSHGGVVGLLKENKKPGLRVRLLAEKYRGRLVRRRVCVVRSGSQEVAPQVTRQVSY